MRQEKRERRLMTSIDYSTPPVFLSCPWTRAGTLRRTASCRHISTVPVRVPDITPQQQSNRCLSVPSNIHIYPSSIEQHTQYLRALPHVPTPHPSGDDTPEPQLWQTNAPTSLCNRCIRLAAAWAGPTLHASLLTLYCGSIGLFLSFSLTLL